MDIIGKHAPLSTIPPANSSTKLCHLTTLTYAKLKNIKLKFIVKIIVTLILNWNVLSKLLFISYKTEEYYQNDWQIDADLESQSPRSPEHSWNLKAFSSSKGKLSSVILARICEIMVQVRVQHLIDKIAREMRRGCFTYWGCWAAFSSSSLCRWCLPRLRHSSPAGFRDPEK